MGAPLHPHTDRPAEPRGQREQAAKSCDREEPESRDRGSQRDLQFLATFQCAIRLEEEALARRKATGSGDGRLPPPASKASVCIANQPTLEDRLADEVDGRRGSVDCEVKAVLPMAKNSWQVDWSEHRYESGSLVESKAFKAVVTVDIEPTRSLSQVLQNPLGIYVVDFHITEVG